MTQAESQCPEEQRIVKPENEKRIYDTDQNPMRVRAAVCFRN